MTVLKMGLTWKYIYIDRLASILFKSVFNYERGIVLRSNWLLVAEIVMFFVYTPEYNPNGISFSSLDQNTMLRMEYLS